MLKIILVLSLVSILCNGQRRDDASLYQYFWQIHGCLKVHREPATWLGAWARCLHEGAQLTAPWTHKFIAAVNELQTSDAELLLVLFSGAHVQLPPFNGAQLTAPWTHKFIAAVNELQTSDAELLLVLFSGAHVQLPPFNGGEFLSKGKKEWDLCGVWYLNGTRGEVDCKKQLPFTCFVPAAAAPSPENKCSAPIAIRTPLLSTNSTSTWELFYSPPIDPEPARCGERSLGYEFAARIGRCYKFHYVGARWQVANRTCVAEGGRLAVPESREVMVVLKHLYLRFPYEYIQDAYAEFTAVGIYRDAGVWKTVDGRSLEQVGYADWLDQPPSNDEPYGYMNREGKLRNWAINELTTYICEKAPTAVESSRR